MEEQPYESAVLLAAPYLEIPYADLPERLRQLVAEVFRSRPEFWDAYGAEERRAQVDEYDLANNPARSIEDHAQWLDVTMDASAWWAAESITPINAAMLLSRMNPNSERVEDAETTSSDEMVPADFRRLKNTFEGASSLRKSLEEWIAYARERGIKFHSWVMAWEEWIGQTQGSDKTGKASCLHAAITGKASVSGDLTAAELLKGQIKAIAVELYDAAKNRGWGTDKESISKELETACAQREITTLLKKRLTAAHMSRHMLTPWDIPVLVEAKGQK